MMTRLMMPTVLIGLASMPVMAQEPAEGLDPAARQHIEEALQEIEVMLRGYAALQEAPAHLSWEFVRSFTDTAGRGLPPNRGEPSLPSAAGEVSPGDPEGQAETGIASSAEWISAAGTLVTRDGYRLWPGYPPPTLSESTEGDAEHGGAYGWVLERMDNLRTDLEGYDGIAFAGFNVTVGTSISATIRFDFTQRPESQTAK